MSEISLKEYLDARLCSDHKLRETQFTDHQRALDLAKREIDRRLDGMNELREQITSERSTYVTRDLFDRMHATLEARVWTVEQFKSNMDGRMLVWGIVVVVIQILLAALGVYLIHK